MSTQVITTEAPEGPVSEQGQEQAAKRAITWATPTETENWVQDALQNDPYKLKCKKGRHDYEDDGKLIFTGITRDQLWVRKLPCHRCHAPDFPVRVERVELWQVRFYRKLITSADLVVAYPNYLDETYLNTGHGRMKPRGIQSAQVTLALRGANYRDTRKLVIARALPTLTEDNPVLDIEVEQLRAETG